MGYAQKTSSLDILINDYVVPSELTKVLVEGSVQSITYILYYFFAFLVFSILFGGLETFWNLLDLLQIISYLKYINTVVPYNLNALLNTVSFIQLSNIPLNKIFDLKLEFSELTKINDMESAPQLIRDDGYTCVTFSNMLPLCQTWLIGISVVLSAKLLFHLMRQFERILITCEVVDLTYRVMMTIHQFFTRCKFMKICMTISTQWYWNGILRTFQSVAYDINFAIVLGLYGFDISTTPSITINSYLTIAVIIIYVESTIIIFRFVGQSLFMLKHCQQRFGSIYEGLKLEPFAVYYYCALLIKKSLFMLFLILLYSEPLYQILNIIMLSIGQIIFVLMIKPFENNLEFAKQLTCEVLIVITNIFFLVLVLDDQLHYFNYSERDLIGWASVGAILVLMIIQVLIGTAQQYKRLTKIFKKIWDTLSKKISDLKNNYNNNK